MFFNSYFVKIYGFYSIDYIIVQKEENKATSPQNVVYVIPSEVIEFENSFGKVNNQNELKNIINLIFEEDKEN